MAKKKSSGEAQLVEFVPNTSINVELSQSDLISVIMSDQVEIWEKELEEENQKLSKFDSEFNPNTVFTEGIKRIIREKAGVFGTIELDGRGINYRNFLSDSHEHYGTSLSARMNLNGIQIGIAFNIKHKMIKDSMPEELKLLKTKSEERNAILSAIVKLQDNIDNQSRFESKIRASISKKILTQQGNETVLENLKAMRESIFSDRQLLK